MAASACSDRTILTVPAGKPTRAIVVASLTPELAAKLDAEGQFELSAALGKSQFPEITPARASLLATIWVRQFGPRMYKYLQGQHGSPIRFASLGECGRILYARSAFADIPTSLPAPYERPYGPWFLATFCDPGGVPTVSVAVSAWATELQIQNGEIRFPRLAGNEFFPMGIPAGSVGEFPCPPELAATLAAQHGRRVAAVPELVMPVNTNGPPQGARWHVTLEGPATVSAGKVGMVSVTELYVGRLRATQVGLAQFIASSSQPTSADVPWTSLPEPGESLESFKQRTSHVNLTTIQRRADTPLSFDLLTVPEGQ